MNFDFTKKQYIGCIPVAAHPKHPPDQSPCVIWDCGCCKKPMWVSKKKREYQASRANVEIFCLRCITEAAIKQGYEPQIQNITEAQ